MSAPGTSNKPVIPAITGIPWLDSIVAAGILFVSGIITGKIVGLMGASALASGDYATGIFFMVSAMLVAAVTAIWRAMQAKKTTSVVVQHALETLETGDLTPQLKAVATAKQLVIAENVKSLPKQ